MIERVSFNSHNLNKLKMLSQLLIVTLWLTIISTLLFSKLYHFILEVANRKGKGSDQ